MKETVILLCLVVPFRLAPGHQGSPHPSQQENNQVKSPQSACPTHDEHTHGASGSPELHETEMNERGGKGMGFSQRATTHHFLLKADGGVIQVEANDPADSNGRSEIRGHLAHIAESFANGDFAIPMFVHDAVPPGVPEMRQLREKINYSFEEISGGGRLVISSSNQAAREAIWKFLRFQIQEHKTGDPTNVGGKIAKLSGITPA